ncbi:DUF5665 domain-containing protein [Pseudomonadota bacterium]
MTTSSPKTSPDKELVKIFEAAGVVDYLQYLQSSKRIMWTNFTAGIAKGFGITIGMTVVLGLLIWLLAKLIYLPVVGEYFQTAENFIIEYTEKTNYEDEFSEMNKLLREIKDNTKK